MWVFKLGGSLLHNPLLKQWLAIIAEHGRGKAVIVPGGGKFADAVRASQNELRFHDASAHRMALLAMAQVGYMLCDMQPRLIAATSIAAVYTALDHQQTPVWLPFDLLETRPSVEESWRMSSDSLSAWLAREMDAQHLVVVKSAAIEPSASLEALAAVGIVDELFAWNTRGAAFHTRIVTADALWQIGEELRAA